MEEKNAGHETLRNCFSHSLWFFIYLVPGETDSHPSTLNDFDIPGFKKISFDVNCALTSQIC